MKKITCHDVFGNTYTEDAGNFLFRPSVYGILVENDKLLLVKNYDGYDLPGGGVELHETIEESLKREFFEETGFNVEVLDPIEVTTSFFKPTHSEKYKDQFWHCPMMYFLVKRMSGELSKEHFTESEKAYADIAEWIPLTNLEQITFMSSVELPSIVEKAQKLLQT